MGTPQAGTARFTHCPHSLQMMSRGFPAAPCLSSGKAWQVKLGEGCQNPMACDLLSSKHRAAAFPSRFLLPHCTLQDKVSVCHVSPPYHLLAPSSTSARQKGYRAAEGSDSLFKAVGRQHPRLDVGSSSTWLLPAWRILFCHLCAGASPAPSCSTCCQRGLQGKGTAKRR